MTDERDWEKTEIDRRLLERIPARVEIRFPDAADAAKALHAYSINFSTGGLCFRSKRVYQAAEAMDLLLTIGDETLSVQGVVAWRRGDVVGIRFDEPNPKTRARLQEIYEMLKRDLTPR